MRTLSATIGPEVALVSAAMTTPPSKIHPTIVVPVLVAFGSGTPRAWRARFRLWLEKSKPGMLRKGDDEKDTGQVGKALIRDFAQ